MKAEGRERGEGKFLLVSLYTFPPMILRSFFTALLVLLRMLCKVLP